MNSCKIFIEKETVLMMDEMRWPLINEMRRHNLKKIAKMFIKELKLDKLGTMLHVHGSFTPSWVSWPTGCHQ